MLGLSTSWKSADVTRGEELFTAVRQMDVFCLELEYRIPDIVYTQLRQLLKKSDVRVVSLHNYCPLPPMVKRSMASGDLFLLSSPDHDHRAEAVKWTLRTLECANDLEARAVVLHCGRVEMDHEVQTLYDLFDRGRIESEEAQEFISVKLALREEKKPRYLDALRFSLEKIAKTAESLHIQIGMENRQGYFELPGPDDFELLFTEFDGAPLYYWHDVGHACINEALTLGSQESLLKRYADRLLGIHFHDVNGRRDHLAPGKGTVDFSAIKAHLKEDAISIMELKPGTSDADVRAGISYLRELGLG
jgi:sugar phosphate isomerase/epimerase